MGGKYFSDVCLIRFGRRSILTERNSLLLNCMKSTGNVIHPWRDWQTRPFLQNMAFWSIYIMWCDVYSSLSRLSKNVLLQNRPRNCPFKKKTNKYHSRVRDRIFAERIFQTNLNHYINMWKRFTIIDIHLIYEHIDTANVRKKSLSEIFLKKSNTNVTINIYNQVF